MSSKLAEAVHLLWNNIGLLGAIILTVWLPGNLFLNYLDFHVFDDDDIAGVMLAAMLIEVIFGPIYLGAMIYALAQLKQGLRPSYSKAISVGLGNWGRLFAAIFVSGLIIGAGLIALIIPGIVLMVRYSLLDSAVILEGAGVTNSRRRSVELTQGIRWQIFGTAVLFLVPFLLLMFFIYAPLVFAPEIDTLTVNVVVDCVLDIASGVLQIAMFLYYWDAAHGRNATTLPDK